MDGARTSTRKDRWLARAEAAYERMFGEAHQAGMVTLTERETVAVLIGRELQSFLLQEHVADDPFAQASRNVRPTEQATNPCCPKCRKPGKFAPAKQAGKANKANKNRSLSSRQILTEAGDIEVTRERWRCPRCRVIFFSARHSPETGDGRLQRAGAAQGGSARGQASLSGGERGSVGVGADQDERDAPAARDGADRHGMDR